VTGVENAPDVVPAASHGASAGELAAALAAGRVTAVELAQLHLGRIAELNPALHAVIAVDEAGALAAAAESDERRRRGHTAGALDGIGVLVKDNIEAIGLPCTAGSRALLDSPPGRDAPLVTRLRAAGMVVLGATNLSEWANFRSTASTSGWSAVGGQTENPWRAGHNTSGSSSGSAAAAAAGLAPLTVGTETDGSIVSPSGACGAVGFKPTRGSVPGAGIVPISSRQDGAGPITRTVADAAALYGVLAGRTVSADGFDPAGCPVAVWTPEGATPAAIEVLQAATRALGGAGCRVTVGHASPGGPFEEAEFDALVAEFAAELPAYLAGRPGPHPRTWEALLAFNRADPVELSRFGDEIFSLAAAAPPLDHPRYLQARATADRSAHQALQDCLGGCELAITLTNLPAWPTGYGAAETQHLSTSSPSAVTGAPSLSLPGGWIEGLPVGISVLGRPGADEQVLAFGRLLEGLLDRPAPRLPELG
jgi:amidase